mgnify:CR=1 FL=1
MPLFYFNTYFILPNKQNLNKKIKRTNNPFEFPLENPQQQQHNNKQIKNLELKFYDSKSI